MSDHSTVCALQYLNDPVIPVFSTVLGPEDTGLGYRTFWFTAAGIGGGVTFFLENKTRIQVAGYIGDGSIYLMGDVLRFTDSDLGRFSAFIKANKNLIVKYARGDESILSRTSSELTDMLILDYDKINHEK